MGKRILVLGIVVAVMFLVIPVSSVSASGPAWASAYAYLGTDNLLRVGLELHNPYKGMVQIRVPYDAGSYPNGPLRWLRMEMTDGLSGGMGYIGGYLEFNGNFTKCHDPMKAACERGYEIFEHVFQPQIAGVYTFTVEMVADRGQWYYFDPVTVSIGVETPTPTATVTLTGTIPIPTIPSPTATSTPQPTATNTATNTPTRTSTSTNTPTAVATVPVPTPTSTPGVIPSPTASLTPSSEPTVTSTPGPTPTTHVNNITGYTYCRYYPTGERPTIMVYLHIDVDSHTSGGYWVTMEEPGTDLKMIIQYSDGYPSERLLEGYVDANRGLPLTHWFQARHEYAFRVWRGDYDHPPTPSSQLLAEVVLQMPFCPCKIWIPQVFRMFLPGR